MAGIADILGGASYDAPQLPVSPDALKRRRAALAAQLAKAGQPQQGYTSFAQPLAQGINAGLAALADRQAAEQEAAGQATSGPAIARALASFGTGGPVAPTAIQAPASASSIGGGGYTAPTRTSTFDPASVPSMLATAGKPYGISPDYLTKSAYIESRFDPNASNPSGAKGMFQFVPSTARQYGLTNPYDPVASADAAARLAADNKSSLSAKLGRDPSDAELYIAHQQGAGGAAKLIGNPTARAGDLVGDRAIRSNGGDPNAPASSFTNLWTSKFNNTGARTASADPQADLPAPGARNAAMDPSQGEVGFQIPPAPQPSAAPSPAPAPYNDEFPGAMIQMAPQANGGDMVPLPPSRPADLGAGGAGGVSPQALAAALSNGPISAPSPANDATIAALAPPNQPAPNAVLIQALDPSALGQSDTGDAAATFSPQLMRPPQQFDPGPSASPMAITVGPSPAPADLAPQQVAQAPLPPPRPQDIAQAAPPMPPPRPADLAQADPRADMPAPGAQEAALSLPPQQAPASQGAGWAQLPGPPLMVSNPLGGINPNANDAGAGAFARDPGNRGATPVQVASNGPTVPVPPVATGGPLSAAQQAPGGPTDIRPQAQTGAAPSPAQANTAQAQIAQAAPGQDSGAIAAMMANPWVPEGVKTAIVNKAISQGTITHVDLGDSVGLIDGRGHQVGSIPKTGSTTVGEGGTLVEKNTGRVIYQAPAKPTSVSEGSTLVDPGTGRPVYTSPAKPMNVPEGTTLVDPNTGRPVFTAPPKNEETGDQKNYKAAVDGGYKGDFNSFLQQKSQRQGQAVQIEDANGTKRTMFYDPVTNSLKTPEEMGAKPVASSATNPFAPVGKQPTGEESKMAAYATRMAEAHGTVNALESQGLSPVAQATSRIPVIGNYLTGGDMQRYNQSKLDFVTAILRQESGASISPTEYSTTEKKYFPQPGDKPDTIEQKRQSRETAIKGYMAGAGSNYTPPADFKPTPAPTPDAKQPTPSYSRQDLEAEARRRGLVK